MILRRFVEAAYSVGEGLGLLTGGGFTTMGIVPSVAGLLVVKLDPLAKPRPANNVVARVPAGSVLFCRIPAIVAVINGLVSSSVWGKLRGFGGVTLDVIVAKLGAVPTAAAESVLILARVESFCACVIALKEGVLLTASFAAAWIEAS